MKKVATASKITVGTKMPLILSAMRWIGAFCVCASSTKRMICASPVSVPTAQRVSNENARERARAKGEHRAFVRTLGGSNVQHSGLVDRTTDHCVAHSLGCRH